MEGLGNRVLAGQRVPVAGGAELNADVYTPAAPGRYPAVVSFGPYSTELHTAGVPTGSNEIGSPPVFTDRGYCPVVAERRGTGRSSGQPLPFLDPRDVDDHEAVIAWAAEQPWCTGEVVLFGTSCYALTQPAVAARRPPALRAFLATELSTDLFRHVVQFGGVPASFFLGLWMGADFTEGQEELRVSPERRALLSRLTNGAAHPLLEEAVHAHVERLFATFLTHTPARDYAEVYARWLFDEKTRTGSTAREVARAELAAIDVPFVAVQNTGYFNLHQFGAYDLVEHAGTPAGTRGSSSGRRCTTCRSTAGRARRSPSSTTCSGAPTTATPSSSVDEDLRLAGAVTVHLSFSCSEIDSHVLARLSRVDVAGRPHLLSPGGVRPVTRTADPTRGSAVEIAVDADRREPLTPGAPVVLRFSLTPAPVLLRAGERLRLELGSRTDLLRESVGHGYAQFDLPVPPYLSRNTVHFRSESWLEVTVVPAPQES
ncbi:putative hydrolase, CocE/NonD family [Geodermatophilus saharensis]|uniref:Putative hydrolase, CocE/NonD family n=1 Tax=Geodermatophilus saharensis TaxID=1137994 RepID=A0A239I3X7_9ACTN|nr:CocE/NonD family hydrolase [Geodermatophilus saharensis]SNS88219.1 putative hydrolase, CocE/NonD family [Geodermatophilus saharensis]